jgi:hypothetical protein
MLVIFDCDIKCVAVKLFGYGYFELFDGCEQEDEGCWDCKW